MDIRYANYLEKGTRRMIELFSSEDLSAEEKEFIASAFTDELANNIGDTKGLENYDYLIYSASVRFVDSIISQILLKENASYGDYETGIKYCARQQQSFARFKKNGWTIPRVDNLIPEDCCKLLQKKKESISTGRKILDEDKQISELVILAEKDLSVSICDQLTKLIDELEQDISICKQKRISLPEIKNKDTRKILKRISETRRIAEKKETVHREILSTDYQIHTIICNSAMMPDQWQMLLSLCQKQESLLTDCRNRKWPLPSVRYDQLGKLSAQYRSYINIHNLDVLITQERNTLSTNKQYKEFFGHCKQQQDNIAVCLQNGWSIPSLSNPDPGSLSNATLVEKEKKELRKQQRRKIYMIVAALIAIAIIIGVSIQKKRAGKAVIPFDASYVVGKDQADIYMELENAGFTNISRRSDDSGWLEENQVISITVDNSENFSKGAYIKPDVSVVITYSSENRLYVTDLLKSWRETEYTEMEKTLKDAGFTNVTLQKTPTLDKQIDKLTANMILDGTPYTNERCYLSKNSPITIFYYALQIGIGSSNSEFVGQDYKKVVGNLKERGFTNVQEQQITTGWAKGNTVVGVTVNYVDTYDSSHSFAPDVKIVVKYSSNDRLEITEELENWRYTDYQTLVYWLRARGFTNISIIPKTTENKSKSRSIFSISFNNEEYSTGECYLPEYAYIKVEYYYLQIKIGQTPKQFENDQMYTDVVKRLESQGFTNIRLQRANDIGWFPIHSKEGTIQRITINGNSDFTETDIFGYDAEIIIVVHTKEDKGCEDITEIAPK